MAKIGAVGIHGMSYAYERYDQIGRGSIIKSTHSENEADLCLGQPSDRDRNGWHRSLARSLRQGGCPTLETLQLHSIFGDDGLKVLAQAWQDGAPCAQTLQCLDLTGMSGLAMGNEGLKALAKVLEVNALPSLENLCLKCLNYNVDEGFIAIIQALKAERGVGSHLTYVKLRHSEMGDAAVNALVEGLKTGMMPGLKLLSLSRRVKKEVIEQALQASGRGKGSGKKEIRAMFLYD